MRRVIVALAVCAALLMIGSTVMAAPKPQDKVALTVEGAITNTNSDKGLELDMAMLEGIGMSVYDGKDPWLGTKKYSGVLISDILKFAGATGNVVEVVTVAKDGKEVVIKIDDVNKFPIMLATKDNNKAIGTGVGGPIKLVFPYTTHPEVEKVYPKDEWSWYIVTIKVKAQ